MRNREPKDIEREVRDVASETYRSHYLRTAKAEPHYRGDLNLCL